MNLTYLPEDQHLALLVKLQMASDGSATIARQMAVEKQAPARIQMVLKAAVPGATTGDPSQLVGYDGLVAAFVASLRFRSVLGRLLPDMIPAPLNTRVGAIVQTLSGHTSAEGAAVPVTRILMDGGSVPALRARALVVMTDEVVKSLTPAGIALVDRALKDGVGAALDAAFLDQVTDGDTPTIHSSGNDLAAMRVDFQAMLDAVNTVGAAALYWIASPAVANRLAPFGDTFPGVSPTGGTLLELPFLVSSVVTSDELWLVDAASLAGAVDLVTVEQSRHAAVEMVDNPTNSAASGTGASLVSMWQTNSVAMRADARFGVRRLRDSAVAVLDYIQWGV